MCVVDQSAELEKLASIDLSVFVGVVEEEHPAEFLVGVRLGQADGFEEEHFFEVQSAVLVRVDLAKDAVEERTRVTEMLQFGSVERAELLERGVAARVVGEKAHVKVGDLLASELGVQGDVGDIALAELGTFVTTGKQITHSR